MAVPSNAVDRLIEMVGINVGRKTTVTVGTGTLADYILQWINDTQTEVCNKANFWFLRTNSSLAVVEGDKSVSLPSDFKDEDGVWLEITTGSITEWTELHYMDYIDLRRHYDDTTKQQPANYLLDNGNLVFRPVADQSYTIRLDYYKYLADLAAGGSSNDLLDQYPDILETGATYRCFRYLGEMEDMAGWKSLYMEKLRDLVIANAERTLPGEMVLRSRPDVYGTGVNKFKNRS